MALSYHSIKYNKNSNSVIIVGAGPAGLMAALSLSLLDCDIHIFEGRSRDECLSMSERSWPITINKPLFKEITDLMGIHCDLRVEVVGNILCTKRLNNIDIIFDYYDKGAVVVDRSKLVSELIYIAESKKNIYVSFETEFSEICELDFILLDKNSKKNRKYPIDFIFCIGADGAHSVVREQLKKTDKLTYRYDDFDLNYVAIEMPNYMSEKVRRAAKSDLLASKIFRSSWFGAYPCLIIKPSICGDTSEISYRGSYWEKRRNVSEIRAVLNRNFQKFINTVLGEHGEMASKFIKSTPRNGQPLVVCSKYLSECGRYLLIGDAAHSVPPIGGQGIILVFRDLQWISEQVVKHKHLDSVLNPEDAKYHYDDCVFVQSLIEKRYLARHFRSLILKKLLSKIWGLEDFFITTFSHDLFYGKSAIFLKKRNSIENLLITSILFIVVILFFVSM